jgi:molybdenum cofactor guanylyltransferase
MGAHPLTGFVLAGGKSTRMGKDKAVLSLHGRTLLETALTTLRALTPQVSIIGPAHLYGEYAPTVPDIFTGCGPLAGIHAALSHTQTEFNMVVAVDTPFLSTKLLDYLSERAINSRSVVTAPEINAYPQPLCAIYSRGFLPIADSALRGGNYKIVPLFPHPGTLIVCQAELEQFAFTAEMFENLNTPEDLERASRRGPANDR